MNEVIQTNTPPQKHSVIGSARIISASILLSRILGFIRDMLCTGFFGWVWDAFVLAFTIPNMFRRLFGEGALSSAFIPTFSDYLHNKERSETQNFVNIIVTALAVLLLAIAGFIIIISLFFPVFLTSTKSPEFIPLFSHLLRIMIPYMPIICLVALLSAILNSLKHFMMPALASVVLNISWIAAFIVAPLISSNQQTQVIIISWAIIVGGLLELLMQIPVLMKYKIGYKPKLDFKHPGVKEIRRLMGPATFGLAIFQINLVVDRIIAQIFAGEGAISALYFGDRIMQFPLALIGISMAVAVFPYLAECVAKNDLCAMKDQLGKSLRLTMYIALPASIGLIIIAQPLVDFAFNIAPRVLLKTSGFSEHSTMRTTYVLAFFSLGVWAYCGLQIVTRAFHAFKDMKTPVKVGVRIVIMNFILNLILVQFLQEGGVALATAISAITNFFVLFWLIQKKIGDWTGSDLSKAFLFNGLITLAMGVVCYFVLIILPVAGQGVVGKALLWSGLIRVIVPLSVGIIFYLVVTALFKRSEFKELMQGIFGAKHESH
jgi:putative peptidoglycan lipid II flippase